MRFHYSNLYAAMPGFDGADAVRRALLGRMTVSAEATLPPCPAPVMLRRRLTALGKLAVTALDAVGIHDQEPLVFASSWADAARSMTLVQEMTETGDVSPAGFAASVHNATSGAATIWLKNHSPAPAISAGNFTTEAGLTECALLLAEHESVVLVRAEAPLPGLWAEKSHQCIAPAFPYVWAMRLSHDTTLDSFTLQFAQARSEALQPSENSLEDLAFLLSSSRQWLHSHDRRSWLWQK